MDLGCSSNDDDNAEKISSSLDNNNTGSSTGGGLSNDSVDGGLSNELSSMNIDTSSGSKKKNTCLFCLKEVKGLQGCSRCGTARYCGRECQVKHWPVHKNSCRDSNDTEDSDEKLEMKAENHSNQGNSIHIYTSNDYHHYLYYNCRQLCQG